MSKIFYPVQEKYISSFRKPQDDLITEMEAFAKLNSIPILSWQSAEFIEQLVQMINPKRVLEIGTAIAYTSIRIARKLKQNCNVDTIELSRQNIKSAKGFIKRSEVEEKINLIEGDALNILPGLKKKYDLIFLDSDKEDYIKLFGYAMSLLKRGGVMVVDNLLWHGLTATKKIPVKLKTSTYHVREFNKVFIKHPELITTILPVGDGLGLGIKK